MLPYLVAFILLTGLIWAAMEWIYYRELHYLRECLRLQSVRLVTFWPGLESWRLAAEKLAREKEAAASEGVPPAAQWHEPKMQPGSMLMVMEPRERLNVVNITAALEGNSQAKARREANKAAVKNRMNESLAQARPRRKSARMRRVAN